MTPPSGGGGGTIVAPYAITVDKSEHGTVTASSPSAVTGTTVTLTVTPDQGYFLKSISAVDGAGTTLSLTELDGGKYTFTMPGSAVTVKAVFAPDGSATGLPFADVRENDWYLGAVRYVYEAGMMNGVAADAFAPNATLTRGMIAQVLYNLESRPAVTGSAFDDVAAGAWYASAVNWAASKQIVGGYGGGLFGPEDSITREQMAATLLRYAGYKGYDVSQRGDLSAFADGAETSAWAVESMQWAVGTGLLSGRENAVLDPTGTATRAEVAQILMNFCEKIAK
ncbi:S-layer homology domain-containing protein [Clostridiales bacterium BX7]|uniref:S-layer homology domain-containing protein n=1 Tax=Feifania hominis TaxID=2763660 RepID=A0A926DG57_9FIRM|nr:S-layer homology domain-containing protein [Feifania hominis]